MALKLRTSVHQKAHEDTAELREHSQHMWEQRTWWQQLETQGVLSDHQGPRFVPLLPPPPMCPTPRYLWTNPWSSQGAINTETRNPHPILLFCWQLQQIQRVVLYRSNNMKLFIEFYSRFCLCFEWEDSLRPESKEEKANLTSTRANFSSLV